MRFHSKPTPALVATGLLATLFAGCGKPAASIPSAPGTEARIVVRTAAVESRTFERRITVQGTVEPKRFADVAARVDGNLDAIWVDEGDRVVASETRLFQVDPVGLSNAVVIAEQALDVSEAAVAVSLANADKARAEARKAGLDYERYARLHKDGKVSDNEYETLDTLNRQAQATVAVAEAQVELARRQARQSEASLRIARKHLADSLAVAPLSGVVSRREAEPGEQMAVGRRVLRIVDPDDLEVAAYLPAAYHADVVPGTTSFHLDVQGRAAGTHPVTYRSPTVDPVLRTFEIKGELKGDASPAVPGSMADLTLVFETRHGLGVPTAAILMRSGRQIAFVVRDGRATQVELALGLQNDGWTEVRSGIREGDRVVVEGQTLLRDGTAVTVL